MFLLGVAWCAIGTSHVLAQPAPNAHPTGGSVVGGVASITQSPTTTTIDQTSVRAAINWQSFNIGSQQTVVFNQPSTSAVALNRVIGPDPSQIAGRIQANGQIIIVNQSGLTFFQGAQVNTSGLMVTAAGIHNGDFMAGGTNFDQPAAPNARIVNRGTITIANAGLAALVAPSVVNSGTISAPLGHVVLAGAKTATLDLYGDGLLSLDVTNQVTQAPSGVTALVTNTGVIQARGGTVQLTARAADGVIGTLVQAGGTVKAGHGTVVLDGIGGSITVEGQLSAAGGAIEVAPTGNVAIAASARISTSSKQGGGVVAIGTTLARATGGPSVTPTRVSANVSVAKGAIISANARNQGNGGTITLLSTGTTAMAGLLSTKGGPLGGDGGMVEVSGGTLVLTGHVDATAPMGKVGTLLLDPLDLYISDTQPAAATYQVVVGDLPLFTADQAPDAATVSWVSPTLLAAQGANLSLEATRDIFFATSFGTANTLDIGGNELLLTAGRNITVDRGFTINSGFTQFTATTGTIVLSGSSGVAAGLITAGQLAALAPTLMEGLRGSFINMTAGSGISLADAALGVTTSPVNFITFTTAAGGVTQSPGGTIVAREMSSNGGVVGTMSLPSTTNAIGLIDFITVTGGDLTIVNGTNLTIGSTLSANNVFFEVAQAGGTLTLGFPGDGAPIPATITAGTGGRITLVADNIVADIPGSTLTTTGGAVELAPFSSINTSVFGSNGLILASNILATIQTNGGTLDVGGYTNVLAGASTPAASASSVSLDENLDVTAFASTLRLDATGTITQPGGPITAGAVIAVGGSVTLTDPGNTVNGVSGFAASTFAFTAATPLALGNITTGTVETIIAPSLTVTGTQTAAILSLTATKADIIGTGSLVVGALTGSSVGATSLTGINQVSALGDFTAGSFTLTDSANLTIAGLLSAPTIVIQAPANQVALGDGATIMTGGTARPSGTIQPALEPSNGGPGAYITAASFVQIGTSTVTGFGGAPSTLQIATSGNMQFDPPLGLDATGTWLILSLPHGTATGDVFVNALDVLFSTPGSANLFGTINGISGGIASAAAFIQPGINNAYRFNNCVIASTVCTPVTSFVGVVPYLPGGPPPVPALEDILAIQFLMLPQQPGDWVDPDVVPPNVSFVDY